VFLPGEDVLCVQAAEVYTCFVDSGQEPYEREKLCKESNRAKQKTKGGRGFTVSLKAWTV
jgi:hypothetical protein